jgi:hypothetical protein
MKLRSLSVPWSRLGGVPRPGTGTDLGDPDTEGHECRPLNPYASRILDLPPSRAVWALRLRYTLANEVSHDDRWVVDAGPARFHLARLIEPAGRFKGAGPLLILEGHLVRRWSGIPVEVELSPWSGRRSELAVRSWRWPDHPRWYFPAAVAALRTLQSEVIAWSSSP